jgi:hypothetical protein
MGFGAEPLVRHLGALVWGGALQLEGVGHEGQNLLVPAGSSGAPPPLGPKVLAQRLFYTPLTG